MGGAGRLEEGLPDLEGFDRTTGKLGADLTFGDVGGDRAAVAMGAGKSAGTVEHAHDGHSLTRDVRQGVRGDRFNGVEGGCRGIADRAQRLDHLSQRINRDRKRFPDQERTGQAGDYGCIERPSFGPATRRQPTRKRDARCSRHWLRLRMLSSERDTAPREETASNYAPPRSNALRSSM